MIWINSLLFLLFVGGCDIVETEKGVDLRGFDFKNLFWYNEYLGKFLFMIFIFFFVNKMNIIEYCLW